MSRAAGCVDTLEGLATQHPERVVQINEFLLHEAMAQLQVNRLGSIRVSITYYLVL